MAERILMRSHALRYDWVVRRLGPVLAIALLLQGCRSLAGYAAVDDDDARIDAHAEAGWPDGHDDARIDAHAEAGWPDAGSVDVTSLAAPCVFGASLFSWQADMVMCSSGAAPITQCTAPLACNGAAGWGLCTSSQYLARGGETTPAQTSPGDGWLSGCIRAGGAPHAPTDGPCPGACLPQATYFVAVAWYCTGGSFNRNAAYVGVATRTLCRRVGVDSAENKAFWSFASTDKTLSKVVCCK